MLADAVDDLEGAGVGDFVIDGLPVTARREQAVVWLDVGTPRERIVIASDWLAAEHGVDTQGWELVRASAVSADGRTLGGDAVGPNGQREAWLVALPE